MLAEKVNKLKKELIEYASLIEHMVEKSIEGLVRKDKSLLQAVRKEEEDKANRREIELDEACTVVIAQFQPKAKDLRTILMIMKMNNDLERMGDHAVNIAKNASSLIEESAIESLVHIPEMAKIAMSMLRDSISSFIEEDAKLAKAVCERDDSVDDYRRAVLRQLLDYMHDTPDAIDRSTRLINISKDLERIADLSTNICEDVLYVIQGRVIKHHNEGLLPV